MKNHDSYNKNKEDAKCAPDKTYHEGSCYTTDQLIKIASIYKITLNLLHSKIYKI